MSINRMLSPRRSLVLACGVSVLGAVVMIWLFAPTLFSGLRTAELLIVVGLLLLPGPTGWALWHDAMSRREVVYSRRTQSLQNGAAPVEGPSGEPAAPAAHAELPVRAGVGHAGGHAGGHSGRALPRRVLHEPAYSSDSRERV